MYDLARQHCLRLSIRRDVAFPQSNPAVWGMFFASQTSRLCTGWTWSGEVAFVPSGAAPWPPPTPRVGTRSPPLQHHTGSAFQAHLVYTRYPGVADKMHYPAQHHQDIYHRGGLPRTPIETGHPHRNKPAAFLLRSIHSLEVWQNNYAQWGVKDLNLWLREGLQRQRNYRASWNLTLPGKDRLGAPTKRDDRCGDWGGEGAPFNPAQQLKTSA